jgi:hypothetical protein
MSSRERWTVYPLLFLAIGLAIRAAIVAEGRLAVRVDELDAGQVQAGQVSCEGLIVTGTDGTVLVHLGRVIGGGGGRIEIKDATGVDAIAIGTQAESRDGVVEFFDTAGEPAGRLDGEEDEYARQDSNLQPSVPKTDALSN